MHTHNHTGVWGGDRKRTKNKKYMLKKQNLRGNLYSQLHHSMFTEAKGWKQTKPTDGWLNTM